MYVGGVCDALTSGNKSNLRASVYELTGNTFAQVFDFPLTYPKGYPAYANRNITGWFPWTDTFDNLRDGSSTILRHPVPMFTDIEFDVDGSMVLGFGDRTGWQGGDQNYRPDGSSTTLFETNSQAGDILRAFFSNGTFVLENNAKAGPNIGYGPGNSQGPGFGEFYNDNWLQDGSNDILYHAENIMGALALRPGTGEVVVTTIDPVDQHPYAGGVRYMNNSTGQSTGAYAVYITRGPDGSPNPGTFAKATGLGDIELSCNTIDVIQLGNRVWVDTDQDGEQDACEKGLSGVSVSLYRSGTLVARTLTDGNGEYYFPNYANPSSVTFAGSQTALSPNTAYQIVFGTNSQFASNTLTVGAVKYLITVANATGTNLNDLNDSDAQVATVAGITAPVISVTTGGLGTTHHTYDAGFICVATTVASVSITPATCPASGTTANNNGRVSLTGIQNADKAFLITTSTIPSYTATGSQPVAASAVSFTGLANPTSTSGTSYSVVLYNGPCCFTVIAALLPQTVCTPLALSVVVAQPVCNSATNNYTATGTISLTNSPAGSLTITDNGATIAVISLTAGQTSISFSVSGLSGSSPASHSVVASLATTTASTTYATPASCTVCSLSITTSTLASGIVGTAYSQTIGTTGGNIPLSYTLAGGSLPTGLSIDPTTGVISGTPTTSGIASFSVRVTDVRNCTALVPLTISTGCPTLTLLPALLPNGQVGAAYSQALTASGGTAPYSFSVSAGTLPAGLVLTSGVISGTPTASSTSSFTVAVRDVNNCPALRPLTIEVSAAPVCSLTATATPTICNSATNTYTVTGTVSATNGPGTQSLTIAVGSVNSVVTLTGDEPVSYTLNGLDSDGLTKTVTVLSSATACGATSVTYSAPVSCTVGLLVVVSPAVCNTVTNNYTATGTVSLTNAPAGTLTLTDNGTTVGTISVTAGQISASFTLTGVSGSTPPTRIVVATLGTATASTTYATPASCTVCSLSITTTILAQGQVGTAYSQTLTTSGGTAPLIFAVSAGSLPDGLSLSSAGVISGTPTSATTASFSVQVTDAQTCSAVVPLTITTSSAPVCSLTATVTPEVCNTATNTYSVTGTVASTNGPATQSLTISVGSATTTVTLTSNGPVEYTLSGLTSDGLTKTVTVVSSASTCGMANATYEAPVSCTAAARFDLSLSKTATNVPSPLLPGSKVTFVITVTNEGDLPAAGVEVTDYVPAGLSFVAGDNTGWATSGANVVTTLAGPIAPGGSANVSLVLTLTSPGTLIPIGTIGGTDPVVDIAIQISTPPAQNTPLIYGLTAAGNLVTFNSATPGTVSAPVAITGITAGQTLVGFDTRPLTGELFALGYNQAAQTYQLYKIDAATGSATTVTAAPTSLTLGTGPVGFDFNPTVDRIRVVSADNKNFRLNPITGGIAATDADLAYNANDINAAANPAIGTIAYTNSFSGATTTTLYDYDDALNVLATQLPPNDGVLNTVGTSNITTGGNSDLDIYFNPATTRNEAYMIANGTLYLLNLSIDTVVNVAEISNDNGNDQDSTPDTNPKNPGEDDQDDAAIQGVRFASLGNFVFEDVNADGIQDAGDLPVSGATVTLLQNGSAVATTTTSVSGLYSFTGLTPGIPYSVSFTTPTSFSASTSANVGGNDALDSDAIDGLTGPYTLTAGENNPTVDAGFVRPAQPNPTPVLDLTKLVSTTKAQLGEVISYTVTLTNTGPVAATSVIVSDTYSAGLTLIPASVSVSTGSFTPGMMGGTWAIASLPAGATATLTYSASITVEGISYNAASIPGDEAQVCTSVPFAVCKGTPFALALSAPAGFSRYQWYHTAPNSTSATILSDGTLSSFTATLPGEYKVIVDEGISGRCAQLACCPILIEEVEVPLYTAQGKNPTCVGTTPQANGQITLVNLGVDPTVYFYQVSAGTSFTASTAVPPLPAPVPADGVVGTGLPDGTYTVRVWVLIDGQPSCPRDVTVTLMANCACPEEICVPISIRKVKKP